MKKRSTLMMFRGALILGTLGIAACAKREYEQIKEEPVIEKVIEFPKEERLYDNMTPTCKMVEFNKSIMFEDEVIKKNSFAFQISANDDFSFIRYGNKTGYIKNEDIVVYDTLFEEMMLHNIRDINKHEMYVDSETEVYKSTEKLNSSTLDKYTKVTVLFNTDDFSYVEANNDFYYAESSNLKELDDEYYEYLNHPNKEVTGTYYAFTRPFLAENEKYKMEFSLNMPVYEIFREDGYSYIKYQNELFTVPTDALTYIGKDFISINRATTELCAYENNEKYLSTQCVIGNPGTETHLVIDKIDAVYGERYLNGKNRDGSSYHVLVQHFFPYYGGEGIHDVPYRTDEGYVEGLYKGYHKIGKGSHGCTNVPLVISTELANHVYVGLYVVVFENDEVLLEKVVEFEFTKTPNN